MTRSAAAIASRRWRLALLDRADVMAWAVWAHSEARRRLPRGEWCAAVARIAAAAGVSPSTVYRWAAAHRSAVADHLDRGRILPGYVFRWHWPRFARAVGIPSPDDQDFRESDLVVLSPEDAKGN